MPCQVEEAVYAGKNVEVYVRRTQRNNCGTRIVGMVVENSVPISLRYVILLILIQIYSTI